MTGSSRQGGQSGLTALSHPGLSSRPGLLSGARAARGPGAVCGAPDGQCLLPGSRSRRSPGGGLVLPRSRQGTPEPVPLLEPSQPGPTATAHHVTDPDRPEGRPGRLSPSSSRGQVREPRWVPATQVRGSRQADTFLRVPVLLSCGFPNQALSSLFSAERVMHGNVRCPRS